jgi:3-dehydroquinate synthase
MSLLQLNIKSSRNIIPINISQDIWTLLAEYLQTHFGSHNIFVFTDSNLLSLYGNKIRDFFLTASNFRELFSFPAGEASKSRSQRDKLEDILLKFKAGRDSLIVSIGGGVTGDLVGFVASSLFRGVPLIHVPTSLIAQVDSSIGGKVGINHPAGKNLIGSFYQPEAVFIHIPFLQTLPAEEFSNGMAEVIKYAVALDADLWQWLEKHHNTLLDKRVQSLEKMVRRCVRLKIEVVEKDVHESGYRSILNFGHTIAHGIEQLSRYQVKHGFAVAAGMQVAARLSHQLLDYDEQNVIRLDETLRLFGLDAVDVSKYDVDSLWQVIQSDKKSRNRSPRFTLLEATSAPALFHKVSEKELKHALAAIKTLR